jgi:hypothetical protein
LHAQDFEGKNISQVTIRYRGVAKTVNEELHPQQHDLQGRLALPRGESR